MDIVYQYNQSSVLEKEANQSSLLLSHFNEEYQEKSVPCFFWGKLNNSYSIARSFLTLSKVVAANFMPASGSLRDPVITAGANKIRLEAFSSCCSVYAKVDLLPNSLNGEFLQQGTSNVDFNTEMIAALSQIRKGEEVFFSVGKKEVVLQKKGKKVVEKKVSLPTRWIKGMTTVQLLAAEMKKVATLNKMQIQLLFRTLPNKSTKEDYFLSLRGNRPSISPLRTPKSICIGAIHRLKLADSIVNLATSLDIYTLESENATAFQFNMKDMRFTLMLSRSFWRGFSGEGSSLENLLEEIPEEWIRELDNYAKINVEFSLKDKLLKDLSETDFKNTATRLSSMGLLGYDLEEQIYYYRKLPFKLNRIESLNPRYKNALKIIKKGDYNWLSTDKERVALEIKGSGVFHKIIISDEKGQCTCTWYATHQNNRGDCKHILAAKILKKNSEKELQDLINEFEV